MNLRSMWRLCCNCSLFEGIKLYQTEKRSKAASRSSSMNQGSMRGAGALVQQQQQQNAESSPGALLKQQIQNSRTMLKQKVFTKQTLYTVMPLIFSICNQDSKSALELQIYSLEYICTSKEQAEQYLPNKLCSICSWQASWAA